MDINQEELLQVTLFKDSVLSAADARRMEIIGKAQRENDAAITKARMSGKLADHEVVKHRLALDTERQISAATQTARKEMLAVRDRLVDELFADVEQKLQDFCQSDAYGDWLVKNLTAHKDALSGGSPVTVSLRKEDMHHADRLTQALPGCTVQADSSIRLGGLKATDGRIQYNDTIDLALAAEKEAFYLNSGLNL